MTSNNKVPPTAIFPSHDGPPVVDAPMAILVGTGRTPVAYAPMAILVGVGGKAALEGSKEKWQRILLPIRQNADQVASIARRHPLKIGGIAWPPSSASSASSLLVL